MKIKLLIVGKIKELIFKKKINEYIKWIKKDINIELIILKDQKKSNLIPKILYHFSSNVKFCSFSEEGLTMNSNKFSRFIKNSNKELIFFISGPDGCPPIIKKKSDYVLSLSKFTLPHEMAILILTEQIFRAISIHKNSNYHRI